MKKRPVFPLLLALFSAVAVLLVATSSSVLSPTNFWTDTNIYFTIGRGMRAGLMPYRDLFDHKGPLLYMLYALAAFVSDTSFLGVFLLEIASMTAFLFIGWRIVTLWGEGKLALLSMPILAAVTAACTAFTQGGSAEEFCLPALALALCTSLAHMKEEQDAHEKRHALLFGASTAWVFLIKFTDCGLFFGLGFCWLLWACRMGGVRRALSAALWMLLGFAALVLPVALFFAAKGALKDCISVYFYANLFEYGGAKMSFSGHIYNALAYLRTQSAANPLVAALALAGCAFVSLRALVRRRKGFVIVMLLAPLSAGLLLLFCYFGEMAHPYYALVFAALVPLGLSPLGLLSRRMNSEKWIFAACALAVLASAYTWRESNITFALDRELHWEKSPQNQFAEIIRSRENPTLLDITSLDQGFYLAAGILPSCRYFADNNLETREKREAIDGYLTEGKTRFVVTRWRDPGEKYERVAEASGYFDLGDWRTYYLYERIGG